MRPFGVDARGGSGPDGVHLPHSEGAAGVGVAAPKLLPGPPAAAVCVASLLRQLSLAAVRAWPRTPCEACIQPLGCSFIGGRGRAELVQGTQRAVICLSQWSLVCTRVALRHPDGSWEVRALPAPRDWGCPSRASSPLAPRIAWPWDAAIALRGAASPSPGPLVWESGPLVSARTTWVLWASLHGLTRPLAACQESCAAFTPET